MIDRPKDETTQLRQAEATERRTRREAQRASIQIGDRKIDTSRYVRRQGKDAGDTLLIFLSGPREVVTVSGRENVLLAIEEINRALAPDHPPGFWTGDGADED